MDTSSKSLRTNTNRSTNRSISGQRTSRQTGPQLYVLIYQGLKTQGKERIKGLAKVFNYRPVVYVGGGCAGAAVGGTSELLDYTLTDTWEQSKWHLYSGMKVYI